MPLGMEKPCRACKNGYDIEWEDDEELLKRLHCLKEDNDYPDFLTQIP
ncbi:MAG: hypothetical protein NC318_10840 [Blautia sp.]|nr:hypothetical protein [Lachnoclostridium sp.]MCM1212089.1 hypothetical protein [Blautia sp.]